MKIHQRIFKLMQHQLLISYLVGMNRTIGLILILFSFHFSNGQVLGVDTCSFNSNCDLIHVNSDLGFWQMGLPAKAYFNTVTKNANGMVTGLQGSYDTSREEYFELHFPSNYASVRMTIEHAYDTDTLKDGGYIECSFDEGSTWYNVGVEDSNFKLLWYHVYNGPSSVLGNGRHGFSGNSGSNIVRTSVDFTWWQALKKQPSDSIFMRFGFYSDSIQDSREGWMIEHIEIVYSTSWSIRDVNALGINVHPNPSQGVFYFELEEEQKGDYTIQITDLSGKVHYIEPAKYESRKHKLDLSHLPAGLYLYAIHSQEGKNSSGRLVIK